MGGAGWNAYLSRVRNLTVVLTHPTHPLRGQPLVVLHFRPKGDQPSVVVELPDGSVQAIPLAWTDRGAPSPHQMAASTDGRLSGLALLDLVRLLEAWERKP
jgi:hypothetical protein